MQLKIPKGTSREEAETVIRWDRATDTVTIWTADPVTIRKVAKCGHEPVSVSRRRDGQVRGYEFRIPHDQFRWRAKKRAVGPGSGFKGSKPPISGALEGK